MIRKQRIMGGIGNTNNAEANGQVLGGWLKQGKQTSVDSNYMRQLQ